MNNPTTQRVLKKLLHEIASDAPSNWGGWAGGQPGDGSPLKGLRKSPGGTVNSLVGRDGNIKLSAKKTQVIFEPTMKQSQADVDVKNPMASPSDNPRSQGKGRTVRQVKEDRANSVIKRFREASRTPDSEELIEKDILAGLVQKGVSHLLRRAFAKSKPVKAPKIKATPVPKPPKPPTQAQLKQADLDASRQHFGDWKQKKVDMSRVFKAAHAAGIGQDINPFRVRLDKQARAANFLKQPNETPAAPTTKPRIRIQAGSRIKENETAPTNISSGIAFFSPLLGTTTKKRRKKRK
jgi:hypothetical protein